MKEFKGTKGRPKPLPKQERNYAVAGAVHGSIIPANSIKQAKERFRRAHGNEIILSVCILGSLPTDTII